MCTAKSFKIVHVHDQHDHPAHHRRCRRRHRQVVAKWSPSGRQVVAKWLPSGRRLVWSGWIPLERGEICYLT